MFFFTALGVVLFIFSFLYGVGEWKVHSILHSYMGSIMPPGEK
mgnify:CR=1 FL=1